LNSDCRRRTFSDREAAVATPYARRTSRQAQLLGHVAHAAGGTPAERLLRRLGIRVSDDTILRQLLRAAQVVPPRARIIGIDDWSWRKSQNYGTIIIDLERRAVIDVLEDRDVVTCTDWLRRHPEVEVISRDRCGLYAQAARKGAPQAEQVADRFHIVQNLRMAIEEQSRLCVLWLRVHDVPVKPGAGSGLDQAHRLQEGS
jgi:transposase